MDLKKITLCHGGNKLQPRFMPQANDNQSTHYKKKQGGKLHYLLILFNFVFLQIVVKRQNQNLQSFVNKGSEIKITKNALQLDSTTHFPFNQEPHNIT